MVHKFKIQDNPSAPVSRFRSIAAQVIACMSPNFLLLDLGMAISFSTIALPMLLNAKEGLSLTDTQASWFGSLSYLTQPLGAVFSGPIVDYFGRKKANFLVNIPHLIAWLLMYFAWDLGSLFMANALLGIGTGIMEAPISSYVSEISEPSLRGALCTVTQLYTAIGVFAMYFMGMLVSWRHAALIALVAPIASMISVLMVPDSPVWLLVRGREKDAVKALCYLRGWTTSEHVQEEFNRLSDYTKTLQQCVLCSISDDKTVEKECIHSKMNIIKRTILKFRYVMLCKETLRPLSLIMMYFFFFVMSGHTPIRPNMVNVCGAFGMPDDGKHIVLMVGVISFIMSCVTIVLIKLLGKRKLAIISMLGNAFSCTALSVYAWNHLDSNVFSYDTTTFPKETSYVPLVFFYAMFVFAGLAIPWVLLGEVFPFRSRASAQGLAAAFNYVITFIVSKVFINMEEATGLWGAFGIYAGFGYIGTFYLYLMLPETEGKTLEDIERYYSGGFRTFADDPFINFIKKISRICVR